MKVSNTALVVAGTGLELSWIESVTNLLTGVAPHGLTPRAHTDIPAGELGLLSNITLGVRRNTAATTPGAVSIWVTVGPIGGIYRIVAILRMFDNSPGDFKTYVANIGQRIPSGLRVEVVTSDASTGGTCDFHWNVPVWRFKETR